MQKKKNNNGPIKHRAADKNRVSEEEMQLAEVKSRMNKLKDYNKKIETQLKECEQKAREFAKEGQKQRALNQLKKKKFFNKELDKIAGAEMMLTNTISGIEQAQMDVNVFEALKQGDQVIKELRSKATIDQLEDLMDDHKDMLEQ